MISDNDKTETFSIDGDETQKFNPENETNKNRDNQADLLKLEVPSLQNSNGAGAVKDSEDSKDSKAEEIRKKLKYMEHILDIEN